MPNAAPTVARIVASAAMVVAASLAASSAAVAQPLPTEVTSEWVCETQPHRVTDFRVFNNTAALFSVPRFDEELGEFRQVEVRQSVDLVATMTIELTVAQPEIDVAISAVHEVWMNIPPAPVVPNFPPVGAERDENILFDFPILWADGAYPTGFSDLGTLTLGDTDEFVSSDASVWAGSGAQELAMQTLTTLDLGGLGGNGTYVQETTAQAEVCYRYTYIPADVPDPESDPDPEREPDLQLLPDTGTHNLLPIGLGALALATVGTLLTVRRRHTTPRATAAGLTMEGHKRSTAP